MENPAGDLEAGEARHLDVEEDDVGFMAFDGGDRFQAVSRLRDHFFRPQLSELITELLAGQLLVVNDHDLHAVICSAAISSGISMRARVPLPGSLWSVS